MLVKVNVPALALTKLPLPLIMPSNSSAMVLLIVNVLTVLVPVLTVPVPVRFITASLKLFIFKVAPLAIDTLVVSGNELLAFNCRMLEFINAVAPL
jgi:hypothetical protein